MISVFSISNGRRDHQIFHSQSLCYKLKYRDRVEVGISIQEGNKERV